jgi:hypothetical protein
MKTLTLALIAFAILFISCSQDESTKYENPPIILDENWVEITDTIDVINEITCLSAPLIKWGTVINSEKDYNDLWERSINEYPNELINCNELRYDSTKVKFKKPNVDFNERTVLGFSVMTGISNRNRHIYVNDSKKEYLYLLDIELTSYAERGDGYFGWTSIPKIPSDYKIKFDTTITDSR